jgi:hypothetical protein
MALKVFETYLEWRHLFALLLLSLIGYLFNIHKYKYVFVVYIILVLWVVLYQPPCKQNLCKQVFLDDDGFGYKDNFLTNYEFKKYQDKFVKKYNSNTIFLGNPNTWGYQDEETKILIENFKKKIEKIYGKKLYINYAFLRVYNPNAINPFENYHLDSLHYNYNVTQIRALLNLQDKSNGTFSYKSKCCNNDEQSIKTKENTVVLIQANKLLHKYKFKNGYRCVLVVDLVDSKEKGIHGYFWGAFDFVWDRIQKALTSFN